MDERRKRILIAGGTGMIGRYLNEYLSHQGFDTAVLSRSSSTNTDPKTFLWDTQRMVMDQEALVWADIVINLAGQGIADKIWTKKRKQELLDSRINSTKLIVDTMDAMESEFPSKLINASAIGYYGDAGYDWINENSPKGEGFMADLCDAWEKEAERIRPDVDLGIIRIGVVLSSQGGFLGTMKKLAKLPLGGYFDRGDQYIPWIEISDLARIFELVCYSNERRILVNGTAPNPEKFKHLIKLISAISGSKQLLIPTPSWLARPLIGEMISMFTNSARVHSDFLAKQNFTWYNSELSKVLAHCLSDT